MNYLSRCLLAFLVVFCGLVGTASAGTITLLGTDTINFHDDNAFINPFFNHLLAGAGTNKVLVLSTNGTSTTINYNGSVATFDFQNYGFLTSSRSLAGYEAVYVDSPVSCCSDPGTAMTGGSAGNLLSYINSGGSLAVGDYAGNSYWDAILGFTGGPGVEAGTLCYDPGMATPLGIAAGFNASYSNGCFGHQAYDPAFWGGKGFSALFTVQDTPRFSVIEKSSSVPEPSSLALIALGLAGVAAARRRKTV